VGQRRASKTAAVINTKRCAQYAKKQMRYRIATVLILSLTSSYGQSKTRLPIWTFNTTDTEVYGLSLGYTTTEKINNVTSNGLRFELIGFGILLPLIPDSPISDSDSAHNAVMERPYAERINGINLSPLGTGCNCKVNGLNIYGMGSIIRQVNGITMSLAMNMTEVQNGLQASIFFNATYNLTGLQAAFIGNSNSGTVKGIQIAAVNETQNLRGVQIGLLNKTKNIKGLQIGLWNVNEKRKFPLINF
jgi:hypothetical protein